MINLEQPASLEQFSEGSVLGYYQFLERIGHGGEADVWSAWDNRGKRVVALKLIETTKDTGLSSLQFNREAHLIARLEHPNIVPLYDYGEWSSLRFLAMRYMTSGSLLNQLRSGPLTLAMFSLIAPLIAEALDFIHINDIVHRDLKPGNILLDSRRLPFLTDFGLARQLSISSTVPIHTPEGTLPYMSPEQIRGEAITRQGDLFSFGVMLFEMLTGQLPLGGVTSLAVHQQQTGLPIEDPIQYCPTLPPGIAEVLRRLTADRPSDRPRNAREPVRQLLALLDVSPVTISGPHHDQVEDARDMLGEALKTWTPDEKQYPFSLTRYVLVSKQCAESDVYPAFSSAQVSQMLLYGALRYQRGADVDVWWAKTPEAMRREVCWAMILQLTDDAERLILTRVLALAQTITPDGALPTAVRERLVALAKAGIDPVSGQALDVLVRWSMPLDAGWRFSTTALDSLIVDLATSGTPLTAAALRAIVETRSAVALHTLVASPNRDLARRALTEVWNAVHSLPSNIPWWLRAEVLLRISVRQLTERPLALLADYFWMALASVLAMGFFIWLTRRTPDFMSANRLFNALAPGLLFGMEIGFGLTVACSIAQRLRTVPAVVRLALGTLVGGLITAWAFANFQLLFYDAPPDSPLLLPASLIFTLGFALGGVFRRPLTRAALAGVGVLVALLGTWLIYLQTDYSPLLYFEEGSVIEVALVPALLFALVIGLVSQSRGLWLRLLRSAIIPTAGDFTKNSER